MARVRLIRKKLKGGSIKESNDDKLEKLYNETLRIVEIGDKMLEAKGLQPNKIQDIDPEKIRKKFSI
jgi:hypothetical protein